MKRAPSLRWRLVRTYLILIALAMTLFVLWMGFVLQRIRTAQYERELAVEVLFVASALEEQLEQYQAGRLDFPHLEALVTAFGQNAEGRLLVVDDQGRPLAGSHGEPPALDRPTSPEISAALSGGTQHQIRPDEIGRETLYVAASIRHEDRILGVVRLAAPMAGLRAEIRRQWFLLAGAGLLVTLATTAVSLRLADRILRPVRTLTQAARQIASGALDRRIPVDTEDELREMGRAFNQMADRVAEMLAQQRSFVANASHELRTPLTSIRLWTEALLDGAKDDPATAAQFLREIEAQADRLSHLVEELLDLSRLESGLVPMSLSPTAVPELIHDVVAELQPQMERKGLAVHLEAPDSLPRVPLDRDWIRQLLINLLDNAQRYTPAGGHIGIQVDWHTPAADQLTASWPSSSSSPGESPSLASDVSSDADRREGGERRRFQPDDADRRDFLRISIEDTGQGIPEEELPHIFERFHRVDEARSVAPGGAGLGLSIVKSVVEAHGGRVWVESQVGQGTTVSLTLPLRPEAVR